MSALTSYGPSVPLRNAGLTTSRTLPRPTVPVVLVGALVVVALWGALGGPSTPARVIALGLVLGGVVLTALSASVEGRRKAVDRFVTCLVVGAFLLALLPLGGLLGYTIEHGLTRFDTGFFTLSLNGVGPRDAGGGALHAIIGSAEQVGLATLIAVPLGLLVAVYVVEYGRGRFASTVRFFVDVMTGIPSIVSGLFVLSFWILGLHLGYSGFAASLALTVIMLPIIVRSSEEMLKLVPGSLREASLALGVPLWKTILRIVLPTALPGIVTGIMLSVARVLGETAPVLLTAFGANYVNSNPFHGAQESLPLYIYQQATSPQATAINRAWTAALTLIIIVMVLNLVARLVTRRSTLRR